MAKQEERPILTVDVILFTVRDDTLCIALQHRDRQPYDKHLALIGGYVHVDKDANTKATAERVLWQKAGLKGIFLEQLITISGAKRDPRGWSASVVYYALVPESALLTVLQRDISILAINKIPQLPFDHNEIVERGIHRLRAKGAYSSLPAFLLPKQFTLPQLRKIYEIVMGTPLNDSAFRRKIEELQLIEPVPGVFSKESARPAKLYKLQQAHLQEFDRNISYYSSHIKGHTSKKGV